MRAVPARASCRARRSARRRRRPRPCARSPPRTRRGRRSVRARAAELYECRGAARRHRRRARQRDALRVARPDRDAAGARRRRAAPGRRRSCSRARATGRRAGSCAASSEFAFRGRQPHEDRVAAARRAASGHYLFLVDWTAAPRTRPSPTRSPRSAATARRCGSSAAIPRRDAGFAGWSAPRTATLPAQGTPPWGVTHHQAEGRPRRFSSTGGADVMLGGCSSSTRRTSRSTSARSGARRSCCSRTKAELLEHATWELRSEHTAMPRPVVIRLVSYVKVPRDTHRRKITRRAVFARDGWACQYCGSRSNLTVDHVIPRSKGGTLELGEHRRLVRAVQPPQGRQPAGEGRHAPAPDADARRARTSSSTSRARPSRRRGGSGCPTWPCSRTRRSRAARPAAHAVAPRARSPYARRSPARTSLAARPAAARPAAPPSPRQRKGRRVGTRRPSDTSTGLVRPARDVPKAGGTSPAPREGVARCGFAGRIQPVRPSGRPPPGSRKN